MTYNFRQTSVMSQGEHVGYMILDQTVWYPGTGAQQRMIDNANRKGHQVWLEVDEPGLEEDTPKLWKNAKGDMQPTRGYCSFLNWEEAFRQLSMLKPPRRHAFETIRPDRPVKPYLDLDDSNPPPGLTVDMVMSRCEELVTKVFREEYGQRLTPSDFIWTPSRKQDKLSLHLVISTHAPQLVFSTNLKGHPHGAYKLAKTLVSMRDPIVSPLVDLSVYDTKRQMRTVYSSKPTKYQSVLLPLDGDNFEKRPQDYFITWLDQDSEAITVPPKPDDDKPLKQYKAKVVREITVPQSVLDDTQSEILELVRNIHQTAYHQPSTQQNPYHPKYGVKYNYTDR